MNMRKIIAMTAAVLMLCSIIPMSVFAAPGDVALDKNFDDGTNGGFERSVNENGYIVFDATTADWQNTFQYVNGIKANTNYTVTFKAKANKEASLAFKINNNWIGDVVKEVVAVTTEWQDFELNINSGELTGAIVMFASDYTAASAAIYSIDDVKIVEAVDPALIGKIVNADFETGDKTGWETHQSTVIDTAAAHDGSYGAHLKGTGSWGGMLNQAVIANAGKAYEISFWVKVNANGVNIQIIDGNNGSGTKLATKWLDANEGANWKQFTFIVTPSLDGIFLNFCGAGNGVAEDVYMDSFTCTELKEPSFDGYITNGDFETGKTDSWESVWGAAQISIVEGRNGGSGMLVNAGQWQVVRQTVNVEPNTDYVIQVYAKNASNMTLLTKSCPADANIAQASLAGGDDWTQNSLVFNSGSNSQVYVCVMGNVAGSTAVVDDFFMFKKVPESNDGYIKNGTFETGALTPWENLWGSCPKAEIVRGGKDDNFALDIISGQWLHVRQLPIAVEAGTDYKITLWAKNVKNMNLLVKDGADSANVANVAIDGGEDWTENVVEFNSGSYTSILVSFMGGAAEAYGTFDNIVMEKAHTCDFKPVETKPATCCEDGVATLTCDCGKTNGTEPIEATGNHSYTYDCDKNCAVSGNETRPEADHAYDDQYDADCNYCEAIREVPSRPVVENGGTSISEDVRGLAFKFDVNASGAQVYENTQRVYLKNSATIVVDGEEYALKYMGAIVTNKAGLSAEDLTFESAREDVSKRIINVKATNLFSMDADSLSYAVRIINIPEGQEDTVITARSYFMYNNAEGKEVKVYGDIISGTYNG